MREVECGECTNYGNSMSCEQCIHEPGRSNLFEPASAVQLKERFLESIFKDEIAIDLQEEFLTALKKAWSIVPQIYEHHHVYCTDKYIMSADNYRLIRIWCNVPALLWNQFVVWDEDSSKLYVRHIGQSNFLKDDADKKLQDANKGFVIYTPAYKAPLDEWKVAKKQPRGERFVVLDKKVVLNKALIDGLLAIFSKQDMITIAYREPHEGVKLTGSFIEALIMPVKPDRL